jgi:hypothetical protein
MSMDSGMNLSFLGGLARGESTSSTSLLAVSRTDFDGAYVGAVVSKEFGATNLALGLVGGSLGNDSKRTFNDNTAEGGLGVASASFDSDFLSVEIAASHHIANAFNGWSVTPGMRIRYSDISVGGYTETGTSTNARVSSYSLAMTEVEANIALAKGFDFGTVTSTLGLISRNVNGGNATVGLIGDTQNVPSLYDDATFGTLGLNLDIPVSDSGSIHVGATAIFGDGVTETGYTATLGFGLKF